MISKMSVILFKVKMDIHMRCRISMESWTLDIMDIHMDIQSVRLPDAGWFIPRQGDSAAIIDGSNNMKTHERRGHDRMMALTRLVSSLKWNGSSLSLCFFGKTVNHFASASRAKLLYEPSISTPSRATLKTYFFLWSQIAQHSQRDHDAEHTFLGLKISSNLPALK